MSLGNDISIKERREQLRSKSEVYKVALHDQVDEIRDTAEKWVQTAVVIGGVLLAGYVLMRSLLEKDGNPVKNKNLPVVVGASGGSRIFNNIMEQMALFLLALAKEKLTELLKENK